MTGPADSSAVILVLPTTTVDQMGPVGGWISTSGWAAAAARWWGAAWIVTRHGVLTIDEVRRRAAATARSSEAVGRGWRGSLPPVVKTAVKDAREARRARQFRIDPLGPWIEDRARVSFVWQRHELFHTAGIDLARALDVPSVLFAPALVVWQAEQWSVRRPGWGSWLERHAEAPALRGATLVACGTEVVADQARRLGVPDERILVTPTGADLDAFSARHDRDALRRELGLDRPFVIGWTGSFRPFHALDQLVQAAAGLPDASLLLIGDGPERPRIEALARDLGVAAHFTGVVPHTEIPKLLAAMDVGVVLAQAGRAFHYSPLKVAEYLAAGLPVVAPGVPQLTERLEAGGNAEFFRVGDADDLVRVLRSLATDRGRVERLAEGARRSAPGWSRDEQIRRVEAALRTL